AAGSAAFTGRTAATRAHPPAGAAHTEDAARTGAARADGAARGRSTARAVTVRRGVGTIAGKKGERNERGRQDRSLHLSSSYRVKYGRACLMTTRSSRVSLTSVSRLRWGMSG